MIFVVFGFRATMIPMVAAGVRLMSEKLTRSQIAAINIPVGTLVVAAGAGTGKTTVLSRTVTDKMVADERANVGELLVLTFTRKAASEMAERIAARFKELAKTSSDEDERKWLLTNAGLVPDAAIETLDAFAVKILRDHSPESGLDPDFEVLSEEHNIQISHEIAGKCLEYWLENPPHELWQEVIKGIDVADWPGAFHKLDQHLMTRRATDFQSILLGRGSNPDADIDSLIEIILIDAEKKRRACVEALLDEANRLENLLIETIRIGREKGAQFAEKAEAVQSDLPYVLKWLGQEQLDWSEPIVGKVESWKFFGTTKGTPGEANEIVKLLRNNISSNPDKSVDKSGLLRAIDLETRLAKFRPALVSALIEFHNAALQARRNEKSLSFADCEIEALGLLNKFPEIRKQYNENYKYVIVDEYQDINPLQQELIFKLARESRDGGGLPDNLYLVGDERQSIYGFRDADFTLLRDLRARLKDVHKYHSGTRILHENFRSRPKILNFANHVFRYLWGDGNNESGIEHTDLKPSLDYYLNEKPSDKSRIELHIIKAVDSMVGKRREAAIIARRIRDIVENGEINVTDKTGVARPIKWGDCAVLMRKRAGLTLFEDALSALGIPFITESGGGFWESSEVADITSLLYCISKAPDNLDWAVVLRSPIVGISDNGLYEIASIANGGSWRDVFPEVEFSDGSDQKKIDIFTEWFGKVEILAGRVPVHILIDRAMRESGCLEKFMALNRGRVIRANIEKLISHFRLEGNLSDPYASGNYITWLRDQEIQQSQAGVSPMGESGAVTLATVHASKGREWPLVALADLNSGDPTRGSDRILWSEKNGISFTWLNPSTGESDKPGLFYEAVEGRKARERSEKQRVMYVALTRAREYLILSSYITQINRKGELQNEWYGYKSDDSEKRINKSWISALDYIFTRTEDSFAGKPDDNPELIVKLKVAEPQNPDFEKGPLPDEMRNVELGINRVIHSKAPDLKPIKEKTGSREAVDIYTSRFESLVDLPSPDSRRYLLSATELATFEKCPRMYAYRSVWNVPPKPDQNKLDKFEISQPSVGMDDEEFLVDDVEPVENFELPSSEWGNLAHKLLEMTDFDASPDDIKKNAVDLLLKNDLDPDKYGAQLTELVVNSLQLPLFINRKNWLEVHREFRLMGKVGDAEDIVLGIIDLFAEVDGGLLIIDYKSGKVDPDFADEKARSYSPQLAIYAHLASAYKNIPYDKIDTRVIFLQPAKEVSVPLSKDDLARPIQVLKQLSESSAANDFPVKPDENKCGWCDYSDICKFSVSGDRPFLI
ncbi:MAG: UvrD-helicase domain-containing protein [bacterium]|nr:UvrD-helicase domain-containing protein [bacterium]